MRTGFTDRTPIYYTMTIPNSYNPKSIKQENVRLSYAADNLLEVGVIQMKTSFGNYVRCYDKEKTICDMIRNKKNEDIQLFTDSLKMFARTFSDLSDLDKSEIMNLIAFKKKIREQGVRNVQG